MSTARSATFILLSQAGKLVLNLIALSTLSRILSPEQFGLFAMVTAVLGIGDLFRDFGLSMAAIQAQSLDRHQRSNLFWLNVAIGAVLTILGVALARPVAALYGQPGLADAVAVVATTFLLSSAAAQFRVGLIRENRFAALSSSDVAAQATALATAIACALAGFGFGALVVQAVVQAAVALMLVALRLRWLPGLPNRRGDVRGMVGFGANLLGVQVLTYVGKNVDNVLLGRFWGASALGFYSKAFTLYSQPQTQALAPFTDLAVNTLSRSLQDAGEYERKLRLMQTVANYVALCLFGTLIALADPVVRLLLGPGWQQTALLLQILSIGGLFQVLGNVYYWVFLTRNQTAVHLRCTLITQPIAVACIVAGLPFGAAGVAWGASAGLFVEWLLPATWGIAKTEVDGWALLRAIPRPLAFAGGLGVCAHVASRLVPLQAPVLAIVLGLAAAAAWVGGCMTLWPAVRNDIRLLASFGLRGVRRRRDRGKRVSSSVGVA